jgi:hypothetical protein
MVRKWMFFRFLSKYAAIDSSKPSFSEWHFSLISW